MNKEYEEVDEMTGEKDLKQKPKIVLPIVRLDGKVGSFLRYNAETKQEEVLPEATIEGVMLKHRRFFGAYTDAESYFTNEHNNWKDRINLFERKETKKGWKVNLIDAGTSNELKIKFPNLKMTQAIYFLLKPSNEIVKLYIKGKGLSYLFEYFKAFESGEHIWQYITTIGFQEETSKLGKYYAMTFAKKEMVEDIDTIVGEIRKISDQIKKVDEFYANYVPEETLPEETTDAGKADTATEEIPIVEEEDGIDPKDIPF